MKRILTSLVAVALLAASPLLAADETRWLNVHVNEKAEGANIEVHLPLQLVVSVLNSINVENFNGGKVQLDIEDADIDWPQLLAAVKDAPDGEFVTVDSPEAKVKVSKQGGMFYVNVLETAEENATIKVTLPLAMIDALHFDESNQIDMAALLGGIDQLPNGELVTVDADDATVRVWVE